MVALTVCLSICFTADGYLQVAKASIIVGDPSYFDVSKSRVVGKVVRSICILNHPIKGKEGRSEEVAAVLLMRDCRVMRW